MGTSEFTWKVPIIGEGYIYRRTPQEKETAWHENTRVGWVEYFSLRRGAKYEHTVGACHCQAFIQRILLTLLPLVSWIWQ